MNDLFKQTLRYEAVLQLKEEDFPKLERATVVITDAGEDVLVGVKALHRKFSTTKDGIFASMEQVGAYCKVSKTLTVDELFRCLREELEKVSDMVEQAEKGNDVGEQA